MRLILPAALSIAFLVSSMAQAQSYGNYYDYGGYGGYNAGVEAYTYGTPQYHQSLEREAYHRERLKDRIGRYVYNPSGEEAYLIEGVPGCPPSKCGYMLYRPGRSGSNSYVDP